MTIRKIFAGIFLLTLAVIMLELSLTRLFSATMYYHFAFMAISLALFGGGASGVFIYVIQDRIPTEKTDRWLSVFAMMFSVSVIGSLFVILGNPLSLAADAENLTRLVVIYLATAVPFFMAGCSVSLAIARFAAGY